MLPTSLLLLLWGDQVCPGDWSTWGEKFSNSSHFQRPSLCGSGNQGSCWCGPGSDVQQPVLAELERHRGFALLDKRKIRRSFHDQRLSPRDEQLKAIGFDLTDGQRLPKKYPPFTGIVSTWSRRLVSVRNVSAAPHQVLICDLYFLFRIHFFSFILKAYSSSPSHLFSMDLFNPTHAWKIFSVRSYSDLFLTTYVPGIEWPSK